MKIANSIQGLCQNLELAYIFSAGSARVQACHKGMVL